MSAQTISDFIQSHAILGYLAKLAMSYLLAFPIAWERERDARSAGLRTFPLVAVASCGYMLTGISALAGADAQSRVFYGIITGIGFIGGGAILKHSGSVRGTATAAGIWATGAMGCAVAWGEYEIALALSFVASLTFWVVSRFKRKPLEREGDIEKVERQGPPPPG
ncbi:MgtC/SapB family protein [Desulfocurvibacter africanus]|uniref:MgtC/SapB family protein n=1 Tax=Desulfocurvibacter africanus TaxID=873 RepID=UPI0003F5A28A|nr:MgtC/SapB family protein [Desulfocurvibacter africanus]